MFVIHLKLVNLFILFTSFFESLFYLGESFKDFVDGYDGPIQEILRAIHLQANVKQR
jgi:hypothetical protein